MSKIDGGVSTGYIDFGKVPVGAILPWLKSFTGVPSLPSEFVECNGQTISDSDSPLNGQTLPNLNGENRFLRGNSTSGGSGGASTVTLSTQQIPSHRHKLEESSATLNYQTGITGISYLYASLPNRYTQNEGGSTSHENRPPYYDVVWVIRIK